MAGDDADKDVTDEIGEDIPESEEVMQQESDGNDADQEIDTELDGLIQEAVAAALAEQQDSVLRSQAEVQNMRRRCEQDVERAHKFALEKFSSDLLPVMDNLERALQAVPNAEDESVSALYEGVELTLKGFLETLTKYSLEQLDPEGEPFDPQQHEAMSMVENDDVEPNTVLTVVQKGYVLNGRVIRPAMVMVSKAAKQ
ncbi:MAG: nucleotide exchange factor GrpE [Gammaproteobacteria bacterium]|jgi:molecular chaperone GrpE|nr:nucleotide exchange factor GrpE [Gammaproteobacteria bacterium]MBT6043946.1 nucleotide exchange factor GrpE [Gammaproteobacteria bacterium]